MIDIYISMFYAYCLGAVPFGYILVKLIKNKDVRGHGSHNIGATNVWRVAGAELGGLTFVLDFLKGAFAVILFANYEYSFFSAHFNLTVALISIAVLCGHIFPVWLKFKGGKGIAPFFGILTVWNVWLALMACALWLLVFKKTKISSVAGLAAVTFGVFLSGCFLPTLILESVSLVVIWGIIVYRHWPNIKRLIAGKEASFK